MAIYYGDGSNSSSGRIVQIVTNEILGTYERSWPSNGSGLIDMGTGFETSFTPKDRSNHFLIDCNLMVGGIMQQNVGFAFRENSSGDFSYIKRQDGQQWANTASGYWPTQNGWPGIQFSQGYGGSLGNSELFDTCRFHARTVLASTSGSGAVTWKLYYYGGETSPLKINFMSSGNTSSYYNMPATSSITITEIAV